MHYDDLTREQLVALLTKRDAQRKLGLVWERDEIEHDSALNSDFVVMDLDKSSAGSCGRGPWQNMVIEGDNFDALRWLRMTHPGRVNVIYIDPPYNTGNNDWVYNDHYVSAEDRFKNSTWLEFMYRRLDLAAQLLRSDGVILVSINDDNRAVLELLMDEVFAGKRVGSFTWKTRNGTFADGGRMFSPDHEHVLIYAGQDFAFRGVDKSFDNYANPDKHPDGLWRSGPITCNKTVRERGNSYYPIQDPDTGVWYPCNPARVWAYGSEARVRPGTRLRASSMEQLIAGRRVLFPQGREVVKFDSLEDLLAASRDPDATFPRDARGGPLLYEGLPDLDSWVGRTIGTGAPQMKIFKDELGSDKQPLSSWITPRSELDDEAESEGMSSGYNQDGTKLLRRILGPDAFSYPKPLGLIMELLRQSLTPDGLVVDFFAGSATTAHAVLALNAEDGGSRRFIAVSSSESTAREPDRNICRSACAARIRRAVDGYPGTASLPGDFAYLTAHRIQFEDLAYDLKPEQLWLTIQAAHGLPLSALEARKPIQVASTDQGAVVYCDRFTSAAEAALQTVADDNAFVIIYSHTPRPIREAVGTNRVEVRTVPDYLIQRFQG